MNYLKYLLLTFLGINLLTVNTFSLPKVTRLTPPSELFKTGAKSPIIARFLPDQRFDLQATVVPDKEDKKITEAKFLLDNKEIQGVVTIKNCDQGCVASVPKNAAIVSLRAFSVMQTGVHTFSIAVKQSDGQSIVETGNFEIVPFVEGKKKVKNIIIMLGDGMGSTQRTAARIVAGGYAQGKSVKSLALDNFPVTAEVKTSSLNSIVTDSAPGMAAYVNGNKSNNNEEGVFPDDTVDFFDNPRVEYLSEYLHRTQGKALGLVTTSDVFDATPAANAIHTSNRGAGTGIVDQYFDDRKLTGLKVLMGGGRKWFLPSSAIGSTRNDQNDYAFLSADPHLAEISKKWGAAPGKLDTNRDLIADFKSAGFAYVGDHTSLKNIDTKNTKELLGLFAYSNMNVALDKIDGRRNKKTGKTGSVVEDFGFPDQPMLDEMTSKALEILNNDPNGFYLMVEAASIDKQGHNMDTERWILDTIEFDRAIKLVQDYANKRDDTIVIVTADHEVAGTAIIGSSIVTDARLQELIKLGGVENIRDKVVGTYEKAGFPKYSLAADGYPQTFDVDYKLLVGYGANSDRYEDWRTNVLPIQDSQQPLIKKEPLSIYPLDPLARDMEGKFLVTGQVPGNSATHTASDIPLSAMGPGAILFTGTIDNTDVFFKLAQLAVKGTYIPKNLGL